MVLVEKLWSASDIFDMYFEADAGPICELLFLIESIKGTTNLILHTLEIEPQCVLLGTWFDKNLLCAQGQVHVAKSRFFQNLDV